MWEKQEQEQEGGGRRRERERGPIEVRGSRFSHREILQPRLAESVLGVPEPSRTAAGGPRCCGAGQTPMLLRVAVRPLAVLRRVAESLVVSSSRC